MLPDGAALAAGVYPLHRRGITGRGVRVGLADSGIGSVSYFEERAYRWTGDTEPHPGHGTGMAALLFAVAPDLSLYSVSVAQEPVAGLQRLEALGLDLILCAWGMAQGTPLDAVCSRLGASLLSGGDDAHPTTPAALPGIYALTPDNPWPKGPFTLPDTHTSYQGLSVSIAIACGVAALLISQGVEAGRALSAVTSPSKATPERLLHFLT